MPDPYYKIVPVKTARTPIAELQYSTKDRILHITILNGAEMDLTNAKIHYEKINELTGNKKHLVLVNAANYYRIAKEAWQYASSHDVVANRVAVAHYNSCDANILEMKFYRSTLHTAMPVEIFDTKEEALIWLRLYKSKLD